MPTILIVEDRPVDRTFLTTLLETAGYDVLAASGAAEGLGLLVERRPDLVISDILMPTANGDEFIRRMREIPGLASTPVIFRAATYHERQARALATRCGAVDVLTRPAAAEVVLAKVRAALALAVPAPPIAADDPPVGEAHLTTVTAGPTNTQAEIEASRHRMAAVAEVSHELAMERDLRALLQNVCDKARRVTLAQYAVIGLRDDSLASVETMVTGGIDPAQKPQIDIMPFADGILNTVVRDRRPIRWRWHDPADAVDARPQSDTPPSLVTFLCVPIASPTRVFGWLGQWNKLGAEAFDDLDEQIAVTLGTHAGIAYENAQLYQDLERHATGLEQQIAERQRAEESLHEQNRLTALSSDIGGALIAGATVGDMLGRCAQAFVQHVDAAAVEVWGAMSSGGVLELQTQWGAAAPVGGASRLISTDTSEVGMLARNRTAYATNQVVGDPLVANQAWAQREAILAFAGFPLLVDSRLVAVLSVYSHTPFSDDQLAVMTAVADQMALGLERRRVEAERIATFERTEFALAAAHMGVWEVDVATRRVTWSDTTASMFDSPSPEAPVDRQAMMVLVHPDDRADVSGALARAEHDGTDVQVQFRTHWRSDRVRWIESHARVVHDARGEPVRIVGVAINVTERKLLEDQLRQSQKMEAVGQLAGGVAHNFNNLLTAILGYATVVADQMEETDPCKKDLERILAAGDRAAGLTRQLMAFSRKELLEPASIDLNHLIVETGSLLKHLIGEHIELVVEAASTACRVWADPVQIEQVVMNLAINARDAMPSGGRLTLRAGHVRLTAAEAATLGELEAGPYVTVTVVDTGVGMTPETKQHAFEPFYTTKERGQGTGLGLATVLGIMRQSGGRVDLQSEPGHGAVFTMYFPPAKEVVPVERPAVQPPARGGAETVLVIEDEEAVRCLIRVLLERAGYRVIDAECADQGETLFLENPDTIDLVISDVVMPGTSGPSLLKKLMGHHPGLKALFISGYPAGESGYLEEETEADSLLTSEFAFLQKPFSAVNLVRKVRQVLDR